MRTHIKYTHIPGSDARLLLGERSVLLDWFNLSAGAGVGVGGCWSVRPGCAGDASGDEFDEEAPLEPVYKVRE